MRNYYEILGVDPTATTRQIKSAFRFLARQHHPDIGGAHYMQQMEKIKDSIYRDVEEPERLRKLTDVMFNVNWIDKTEYLKSMEIINEYEIRKREYEREKLIREPIEEIGLPIQDRIESREDKERRVLKEAKSYSRQERRGPGKRGKDPDHRSKWKKEVTRMRKLK